MLVIEIRDEKSGIWVRHKDVVDQPIWEIKKIPCKFLWWKWEKTERMRKNPYKSPFRLREEAVNIAKDLYESKKGDIRIIEETYYTVCTKSWGYVEPADLTTREKREVIWKNGTWAD